MIRDVAYYFGFHMSAHSPRVKSRPRGPGLPWAGFASQRCIKAPTLAWRTNLKSGGSSRNQSNCRFICYFYYRTSPYIFSQLPPIREKVGVLFFLLLLPGPPASQVFVITYFFIGFLGPVTWAPETPPQRGKEDAPQSVRIFPLLLSAGMRCASRVVI